MQTSVALCSRCFAFLQQGSNKGWPLLLARPAPVLYRGRRRTPSRSCVRLKSSSRKRKKKEKQSELPAEGDGVPAVDFPLEGNTSKPDYRASAGPTLPLSVDAERYKSSGAGRYYLHHSEEGGVVSLPSVTTILEETMSKSSYFALRQWRRSMEQEVGEDEFSTFRRDIMGQGARFHGLVEKQLLEKQKVELSEDVTTKVDHATEVTEEELVGASSDQLGQEESESKELKDDDEEGDLPEEAVDAEAHKLQLVLARCYESVREVLGEIGEVLAVESVVRHLELGYMGRMDCIAQYRGVWCIIDWKTSRKPRPKLRDMYDGPLQVCAYMGAVNQDERYPVKVTHALLVAAYESGAPCDVHFLSDEQCREHWKKWLARLEQFKTCFAHDMSNVY